MVGVRYPEADIVVYTDLNTDSASAAGLKLLSDLRNSQWAIFEPPEPTRRGYKTQKDSIIDFFFVTNSLTSAATVRLVATPNCFPSDHLPLALSINFHDSSRKSVVRKV
jgi:endonuclease/exonuclease/phosphatase family metal-dependent hydrolase